MLIKNISKYLPLLLLFAIPVLALDSKYITVTPFSNLAGESTIYSLAIRTDIELDVNSQIDLKFYSYDPFDLSGLVMAYNVPGFADIDGYWEIKKTNDSFYSLILRDAVKTIPANDSLVIYLAQVENPPAATNHRFYVDLVNSDGVTTSGGNCADFATVNASNIESFDITSPFSVKAGEPFELRVSNAVDASGNPASGIVTVGFQSGTESSHQSPNNTLPLLVDIYVDGNGNGAALQTLFKAEYLRLKGTVSETGATSLTGNIQVSPGNLGSIQLAGVPSETTAGQSLAATNIQINLFDAFGNAKTDYDDQFYFASTDPQANLPYTASSMYNFSTVDNGTKTFPGTDFRLYTAGLQTLTATNGTISEISDPINVKSHDIFSFEFDNSQVMTQSAGVPFRLYVQNAVDAYGNAASGTIDITAQQGGATSPNGQAPVLQSIVVSNGSGSAFQTLFSTESAVVLEGASGIASAATNSFAVTPGALGRLDTGGLPEATSAGNSLNTHTISVTAIDIYGNPKTDFTGNFYFTSNDPIVKVPYTVSAPYSFQSSENGVHSFNGISIEFRTAGIQYLNAVSGAVSTKSSTVTITGDRIDKYNFDLITSKIAGTPFQLRVLNAVDRWDNPANDTVFVAMETGGGAAPNGQQPVLNKIPVANGVGTAFQSLFLVESNVSFRGVSAYSSVNAVSNTFSVSPGELGSLQITGYPPQIPVNTLFSGNVIVTALDDFGNEKIDFDQQISFSSSDPLATLPADYTFTGTSQHGFPGNEFSMGTIGAQTLTVQSGAVSETSDAITVRGTDFIRISSVTANRETLTRGQAQAVAVSMIVQNEHTSEPFTGIDANLVFYSGTTPINDYVVVKQTSGTSIPAGGSKQIDFLVTPNSDATLGVITIDAQVNGYLATEFESIPGAEQTDTWTVQIPPDVIIANAVLSDNTIPLGSSGIELDLTINNNLGMQYAADALVDSLAFQFFQGTFSPVSQYYSFQPDAANPDTLIGGAATQLKYYISSSEQAPIGTTTVRGNVFFKDANTSLSDSHVQNDIVQFEATSAPGLQILAIESDQTQVTRGQTNDFTVRMQIKNIGANDLTIDFASNKTFLKFYAENQEYISPTDLQFPTSLDGGSSIIQPNQTAYISFKVLQVDAAVPAGALSIVGRVETTSGFYSSSDIDQVWGSILVQNPANLVIDKVLASQATVTNNDSDYEWFVKTIVRNNGGSSISLDFNNSELFFYDGVGSIINGFVFNTPYLSQGGQVLKAGESDTLIYPLDVVPGYSGTAKVGPAVHFDIVNTGNSDVLNTEIAKRGSVLFQSPAVISIIDVQASDSLQSRNRQTSFTVDVTVQNTGQATAELLSNSQSPWIGLFRNGIESSDFAVTAPSRFVSGATILTSGQTEVLHFTVTGNPQTSGEYKIHASAQAVEYNRNLTIEGVEQSGNADQLVVLDPAQPIFVENSLSPQSIQPGQAADFYASFTNTGGSDLLLDTDNTRIYLTDGSNTFESFLDANSPDQIKAGQTVQLIFERRFVSPNFALGPFPVQADLVGEENGNAVQFSFPLLSTVNVTDEQQLVIQSIQPISISEITQGQKLPWNLEIQISNLSSSAFDFASAELAFTSFSGGNITEKFDYTVGNRFTNASTTLNAQETAILVVTVDSNAVDTPVGDVLISATVQMSDPISGVKTAVELENGGGITVLSPSELEIYEIKANKSFVTIDQDADWEVICYVRNNGQTGLTLDVSSSNTLLNFDKGNVYFPTDAPTQFLSGGQYLPGRGAIDSLKFVVTRVADEPALVGENSIHSAVAMIEDNTNNPTLQSSQSSALPALVNVLDKASIQLDSVVVITETGFVNVNQNFYVKALVSHPGNPATDDAIQAATINFTANSLNLPQSTLQVDSLNPGDSKWIEPGLPVTAPATPGFSEMIHAQITSATGFYSGENIVPDPATKQDTVKTQSRANFAIQSATATKDTVISGTRAEWFINVTVQNTGDGVVELIEPAASDIQVVNPDDWEIIPPVLTAEQLLLENGDVEILQYTVSKTGYGVDAVDLDILLQARELNDPFAASLQAEWQTLSVVLTTSGAAQIVSTIIDTSFNVTEDGVGLVNVGQEFLVECTVRNVGGQELSEIDVALQGANFTIAASPKIIKNIPIGGQKSTVFTVQAPSVENTVGIPIYSSIVKAVATDGTGARARTSSDSSAIVKVMQPARIQLLRTENLTPGSDNHVSVNQPFQVQVWVKNIGTEAAVNTEIRLESGDTNLAQIQSVPLTIPGPIAKNDSASVVFDLMAGGITNTVTLTSSVTDAYGANSGQPILIDNISANSQAIAVLQTGSALKILNIASTKQEIRAGDNRNPWEIHVAVQDTGQAPLELVDVSDDDIVFKVNNIIDADFEVIPPTRFVNQNGFQLTANQIDTLIYTVVENGGLAGDHVDYFVNLSARDLNVISEETITAVDSATIGLTSNANVKIVQTSIDALNPDENNIFYVNRDQSFSISVRVRTGDLIGVDSVRVRLVNSRGSFVGEQLIEHIEEEAEGVAVFNVTADNNWNIELGEVEDLFSAELVSAIQAGSNIAATRKEADPGDDQVKLMIQRKAEIFYTVSIDGNPEYKYVAPNSFFDVHVHIENKGKAAMGTGTIQIDAPNDVNYMIETATGALQKQDIQNFSLERGRLDTTLIFTVKSPDLPNSGPDILDVSFANLPRDLNVDEPAIFTPGQGSVTQQIVYTREASVNIQSFYIQTPGGAQDGVISTGPGQKLTLVAQIESNVDMLNSVAKLSLPFEGEKYQLLSPQHIDIESEQQTITFELIAPPDTLEQHSFTLTVDATDKKGDPYDSVSDDLIITKVVQYSTIYLDDLTAVTRDGAIISDSAAFVWGQEIQLKLNIGLRGAQTNGTGKIRLNFPTHVFELVNPGSEVQSFNLQSGLESEVEWLIRVKEGAVASYEISATLESPLPTDGNAETSAMVANNNSVLIAAVSNQRGLQITSLLVQNNAGAEIDTVSTTQRFRINAKISVQNNITSPLGAKLVFNNPAFVVSDDEKFKTFTSDTTTVSWDVQAPENTGQVADSFYVTISGNDKFSSNISENNKGAALQVVDKAAFSLSIPDDLSNRVSTEQEFILSVDIDNDAPDAKYFKQDSFTVTLKGLPSPPYTLIGDRTVTIQANDYLSGTRPQWNIRAPEEPTLQVEDFVFDLENSPRDFYSNAMANIVNGRATHRMETIQRATISLQGFVGEPEDGKTSTGVRYGNMFKITALLDDIGLSGSKGSFQVELIKTKNFEYADESITSDTSRITGTGNSVSWNLIAPDSAFFSPDTLKLRLLSPPQDSLSGLPADILVGEDQVFVWVETGVLLVSDFVVRESSETIIQKGRTKVPLLGMSFANRNGLSDTESFLDSLSFQFLDRTGNQLDAGTILSRIYATTKDDNNVLAEYSSFRADGKQSFVFDPAFEIIGNEPDSITIYMDIRPDAENKSFVMLMDSTQSIHVRDTFGQPLILADDKGNIRTDERLGFQSNVAVIVEERAEDTFFNYPNPFGRTDRPETKFAYYLEQDSDFDIHIYTLAGELVWAQSYSKANDPLGFTTAGLHQGQLVWDGKNGMGQDVVNGVYIAYIKTEHDTRARNGIKIAVVR